MKKKVFLFSILLAFSFFAFLVSAQEENTEVTECAEDDVNCNVDRAYICLEEIIEDRECENLSSEEKLFAFLATGECGEELIDDSEYESDLRYTAIAALGLETSNSNTEEVEEWLLDRTRNSVGIDWFLEIESQEVTSCSIDSDSVNAEITIGENKQITSLNGGGNCLSLSDGNYWLEIDPDCYNEEFSISCDQGFLTTLLYQRQGSETIFVSEETHAASAGGITGETVNSLCFGTGSACDYEGSLWAAFALGSMGNEVDAYLPYLITLAENNDQLLPEAFLYFLTSNTDFRNQLLEAQINDQWWSSGGDRFYGTAIAMYPFQHEETPQKEDVINWLLDVQNEDGCWDSGDIRSTGFILSSLWPRAISPIGGSGGSGGGSTIASCSASGFYCTSSLNCGGEVLSNYACSGAFVCCSEPSATSSLSCFEQGGEICNSNQQCAGIGGVEVGAAGLISGQSCCVGGSCQSAVPGTGTENSCESSGGSCRVNGCNPGESENFGLSCDFTSDVCCILSDDDEGGSLVWVWVLLLLIILIVVAIIFRDKLREFWIRIKSRMNKKGPEHPRGPPLRRVYHPSIRRPTTVHQGSNPPARMPPRKPSSEIDEVLKKLKEIGK